MNLREIMDKIEDIAKPGTEREQAIIRHLVLDYFNLGYRMGGEESQGCLGTASPAVH